MAGKTISSNLESLDLIRGAMALFVFLSHTSIAVGSVAALPIVFKLGGIAVDIFMFVSGFLMMWHYVDRQAKEPWERPETWGRFYLRRFFRIAPLYYVLLTLSFLLQPTYEGIAAHNKALFPLPWAGQSQAFDPTLREISLPNVLAHYTFVFGLIPAYCSNTFLPDWSIGLEMQFYAAFPFIVLLIAGKRRLWLGMAALAGICWFFRTKFNVGILTSPGAWGLFPMPTLLPLSLLAFLAGILVCLGVINMRRGTRAWPYILVAAAFAVAHNQRTIMAAFILGFAVLEKLHALQGRKPWASRLSGWIDFFLRSKPVSFFAECSYGVYLIHTLIMLPVLYWLSHFSRFVEAVPVVRFGVCVAVAGPLVYLSAWLLNTAIEQPGIKWGKSILHRWQSKPQDLTKPELAASVSGRGSK